MLTLGLQCWQNLCDTDGSHQQPGINQSVFSAGKELAPFKQSVRNLLCFISGISLHYFCLSISVPSKATIYC